MIQLLPETCSTYVRLHWSFELFPLPFAISSGLFFVAVSDVICFSDITCLPGGLSANGSSAASALPPLTVPKPKETSKWALQEADFGPGLVGGKSANLAKLRGKVGTADTPPLNSSYLNTGVASCILAGGLLVTVQSWTLFTQ